MLKFEEKSVAKRLKPADTRFQWSVKLVTVIIVISFGSVEMLMQYFIDPLASNSVKSVVGAVCLCVESWQILLLDARCTENMPFETFLVLESLPFQVFLYRRCGVYSSLNDGTEINFYYGEVVLVCAIKTWEWKYNSTSSLSQH